MTGSRILVVGDIVNDIVVVPRGAIRPDTDTSASIRPRPGGSAANTAAWLGSLGARVDFVGSAGAADAATHEQVFREHGVEPHLSVVDDVPTGTIVIVVEGEQRTMLTERGANAVIQADSVTEELLAAAAVLHLSGYTVLGGFGARGAREVLERAGESGVPVSINPGSVGYLQDFGIPEFLDAVAGATVLFPNLAEGRSLTGESDPDRVAAALLDRFPIVVVTLGAEGALIAQRGRGPIRVPAPSVRVVDPTGAGDAFTAGFLEHWVRTGDAAAAAEAGVFVAARAVMLIGGRPPI